MTVIPAKVAGVEEVIICSPNITNETIVAADIAGADRIFRIGGIQAIAALAYGTDSIPAVDKIVGPGNKYVTAAKKEVFGRVGIDFIAGPSEVLVVADYSADVSIIAADLLAQAEHDTEAGVYAICTDEALGQRLQIAIDQQLQSLPTKEIASASANRGYIIVEDDLDKVATLINKFAPEHLEIQLLDPEALTAKISNYGSLFIGQLSAEVFGDYCSGPNHTLPTNRSARYTGGLSVKDFIKLQTYHKLSLEGVKQLIPIASKLANTEGLIGHQRAANIRNKLVLREKLSVPG